ncbi:MAG: hypothetical protein JSS81_06455 [Acidobacteria bacterium]|nr:hypothetical protein [Acidobacteriota bacterium]
MKLEVPEPLPIEWFCKPVGSARAGVENLDDGRIYCWIEHETVKNVTPEMLVWWFGHLEGTVEIDGVEYDRYRVWHPRDHLFAEYARRGADGRVGVGSVIHLAEMFGANPRYLIHIFTEIKKLDETGYEHHPRIHGLRLAVMKYSFESVPEGTFYRNSLTIGLKGFWGKIFNPLIRRFVFDERRGAAWIRHNVEEVGNFEFFLPALFAAENEKFRVRAAA